MSMHLTIYVGPFLRCKKKPGTKVYVYELTDSRLDSLRGELAGEDGDEKYIGPNVEMPGIARQLRFDRDEDTPVLSGINMENEIAAFISQFTDDIQALRKEYESATVEWGVVPGYY